ncbi:MAG TPA: hypothetical protein VMY88_12375 [Acidimicrobiales bacterium]|nr:hypothetical protein [Acidimicrobiales bacterium]
MAVAEKGAAGRAKEYPPLAFAMLAMLLLLALMPSALNLPQTTPSETLEYAPVPPEDDQVNPPTGNFNSLGLGSSDSFGGDEPGGAELDPLSGETAGGVGKSPSTKRCVGNPPRQTEDPLSPPCVAVFNGDNGGATYQGVTPDEVRVLFYLEGCGSQGGTSEGDDSVPCGEYFDLADPPPADDHVWMRMLRPYQRFFNERYQTYGRFIHFFAYYDNYPDTAETRRADAAATYAKIKPFAVYNQGSFGFTEEYTDVMLSKGVLVFTGAFGRVDCCESERVFQRDPGLRWGAAPSTEQYAALFSDLICKQVVGRPVSYGGNNNTGQPRVLGMINNDRPGHRPHGELARLVRRHVEACGGQFLYEAHSSPEAACSPDSAATEMAEMQRRGVTTIIWPIGSNSSGDDGCGHYFQSGGVSLRYLPEVVVAGNGSSDDVLSGQLSHQEFSRNQLFMSAHTRGDDPGKTPCIYTAREAEPDVPARDLENFGCAMYAGIRLMFTGIQVAGPKLTPQSMDKGYHAIPDRRSTDPFVPACYFDVGDYTCIKDAQLEHWDASGQTPGTAGGGCLRMVEGGQRYVVGSWPERDIAALVKPDDPCNRQGYSTS